MRHEPIDRGQPARVSAEDWAPLPGARASDPRSGGPAPGQPGPWPPRQASHHTWAQRPGPPASEHPEPVGHELPPPRVVRRAPVVPGPRVPPTRAGGGRSGPGGSDGPAGPGRRAGVAGRGRRKGLPLWQELPLLLAVAFCLAVLIRTFLLQAFFIPSGSMEDTLLIGDRVLVNKVVYDLRDPARGEIVVFRGPPNWVPEAPTTDPDAGVLARLGRTVGDLVGISTPGEKDFIKRVIGVPGDTVACCDAQGRVTVNGTSLDEPYVTENSPLETPPSNGECRARAFDPVQVADGQLFVMGDHRLVSQDSRCQGPVPISDVIGRAFVIAWPSGRWDTLPVPSTFDAVPQATASGRLGPAAADRSGTGEFSGTGAVLLPLLLMGRLPIPVLVSATSRVLARSQPGVPRRQRRLAA